MSTPNSIHTLGGLALAVALSAFSAGAVAAGSQKASKDPLPEIITFSVPYSFSNLDPSVKDATIRCTIGAHVGETRIKLDLSGEVRITDRVPRSGTATVIAHRIPGMTATNYTQYTCSIWNITNGTISSRPGTSAQPGAGPGPAQPWAQPAFGSVLGVSGSIK